MNEARLQDLVARYTTGDITPDEHDELSIELKNSDETRRRFRELVDLEASLNGWANESSESSADATATAAKATGNNMVVRTRGKQINRSIAIGLVAIVASIIIVTSVFWNFGVIEKQDRLGYLRQSDCVWTLAEFDSGSGDFYRGNYSLESGVAELTFLSGSTLTLEGPCELFIESSTSARLESGNAVINISDDADGFLLTTRMARIVDLGTEYGVSAKEEGIEVHVFDGSVVWEPLGQDKPAPVEVYSGQAKWFSTLDQTDLRPVTFGRVRFVRQLDSKTQSQGGDELVAYDGFENLAGRIRRGRSGFGWQSGWAPPGRRRVNATIVDALSDSVFGLNRSGRREMLLGPGVTTQRELKNNILSQNDSTIYISLLLTSEANDDQTDSSFQLLLRPMGAPGRKGLRGNASAFGFGMSSGSSPFVKCGGVVNDMSLGLSKGVIFCVARFYRNEDGAVDVKLRFYQADETIESDEPKQWNLGSVSKSLDYEPKIVQLISGAKGSWRVDELKIGSSWRSVVQVEN